MPFNEQRTRMVEEQLKARGLRDERVLAAFRNVPRHLFLPPELRPHAYTDRALPIGAEQTISQPYIVALMVTALRLQGHERVLEVGTGSGYETAILAELALEVFSMERLAELSQLAKTRLDELRCLNVHLAVGDGSFGWPEHAPYDAVIVSAAAPEVPRPLIQQLGEGGRMAIPVGPSHAQSLLAVEKHGQAVSRTELTKCVFIPLIGAHGWPHAT